MFASQLRPWRLSVDYPEWTDSFVHSDDDGDPRRMSSRWPSYVCTRQGYVEHTFHGHSVTRSHSRSGRMWSRIAWVEAGRLLRGRRACLSIVRGRAVRNRT